MESGNIPQSALPEFRPDLVIREASFCGVRSYIVKDPVSLTYTRIGHRERALAALLDGKRTAGEVKEALSRAFPGEKWTLERIDQMVGRFLAMSYLRLAGSLSQQLIHRQRAVKRSSKAKTRWLEILGKIISFQITLFDPDILLLRMSRYTAFLWTKQAAVCLVALWVLAGYLMFQNAGRFSEQAVSLFSLENLFVMWVVLIFGKVVHEFGHGLACKHFGAEVHGMGVLFILFSPFFFCDATDSWMFQNKWQRIIVNFAGIYLELFLAAFSILLWAFSEPGLINQMAFNLFIVSSVITIFFNVNPLMKFDGYYALADLTEIPNLKDRSTVGMVRGLAGFFVGKERFPRDPIFEKYKWPILSYGIASYLWTITIFFSLLNGLSYIFKPYGLDKLFSLFASITLSVGIVAPFFMAYQAVAGTLKKEGAATPLRARVSRRLLAALAIVVVILLIPLPDSIKTSCAIDLNSLSPTVAGVDGFLREISVRPGQRVEAGQTLARLENSNLASERLDVEKRLEIAEAAVNHYLSKGERSAAIQHEADASQYRSLLEYYQSLENRLVLAAPASGLVAGDLSQSRIGSLVRTGQTLCQVAPESGPSIQVFVPEIDASRVRPGQNVTFRLYGNPWKAFHGAVESLYVSGVRALPTLAIAKSTGGDIPTRFNPQTGQEEAAEPVYVAQVRLDDRDNLLRAGMTGRARIQTGWAPLGAKLYRWFTRQFRLDVIN